MPQPTESGLARNARAFALSMLIAVPPSHLQSQGSVPTWHLGDSQLEIGGSGIALHRVRSGVVLRNDLIALADAGNARVVLVSANGAQIGELGRRGSGPGDFQSIDHLAVFGDTLLAYDPVTQQVSLWEAKPKGRLLSAISLVEPDGTHLDFRGALSTVRYLVTTRSAPGEDASPGLIHDRVGLLLFEARSRTTVELDRLEWRRLFVHRNANGVTKYTTPFIGESVTAVVGGRIVSLPLGRSRIDVYPSDGRADRRSVSLPVPIRVVNRAMVNQYRDSLLQRARRQSAMFPNAVAGIEAAFGPAFPLPQNAAVVRASRTVGDHLWVQIFPAAGEALATWYVVDPSHPGPIAQVHMPRAWEVLGGDANAVLILQRDELGVESVRVHSVVR